LLLWLLPCSARGVRRFAVTRLDRLRWISLFVCSNRRGLLRPFISFYLPLILPESLGSLRSHRRERQTRDDGWCEEGCSEGACKNSSPYLRTSLSALLRRQSKFTKAAEADAAHARIVCQKPVNLRGRHRGHRKATFNSVWQNKFYRTRRRKRTRAACSKEPRSIYNLISRVNAPAQVMKVRKTSSGKDWVDRSPFVRNLLAS